MALAFSESGHNLKEASLWQECGYASGASAQVKQVEFNCGRQTTRRGGVGSRRSGLSICRGLPVRWQKVASPRHSVASRVDQGIPTGCPPDRGGPSEAPDRPRPRSRQEVEKRLVPALSCVRGQESEMAHAMHSLVQDLVDEPPDELLDWEDLLAHHSVALLVPPEKANIVLVPTLNPVVGHRRAANVACNVAQNLPYAAILADDHLPAAGTISSDQCQQHALVPC